MATKSAFNYLITGVRSNFALRGITALVSAGWRERMKQIQGGVNRVVFVPSDLSGAGGTLTKEFGKSGPGGNPRPLLGWRRRATICVWAHDATDLNDEAKQIEATETLAEQMIQAANATVAAAIGWGETTWSPDPTERKFGLELLISIELGSVFFDVTYPSVTPTPVIEKEIST